MANQHSIKGAVVSYLSARNGGNGVDFIGISNDITGAEGYTRMALREDTGDAILKSMVLFNGEYARDLIVKAFQEVIDECVSEEEAHRKAQETTARFDNAAFQATTPWSVERMYLDDSIHIVQRTPGAGNLCIGPFGSTDEAQAEADRMNSIEPIEFEADDEGLEDE